MIRIIAYILIYTLTIAISFAQVKSDNILIKNNDVELAGTLTYTNLKTTLLIWVHGSGNVDRNGNQEPIVKANYIKQFRDSVNKHNIAFFSYDKRTANKKNISILKKGIVFEDYVSDLKKVINHFKNDNRFSKIILIGHSQGSLVSMLSMKNADKFISLAGPHLSADKTIIKQYEEKAPFLKDAIVSHFKELNKTGTIKELNPMLSNLLNKTNQQFIKSWMQYNPTDEIKKINKPILLINGDSDLQVKIVSVRKLQEANPKSKSVIIKNMNHVLKQVNSPTENQQSYFSADFPLATELIKTVVTFANK